LLPRDLKVIASFQGHDLPAHGATGIKRLADRANGVLGLESIGTLAGKLSASSVFL